MGLKTATDENLNVLLQDLESYKERLPDLLQFRGPSSSRHAGRSSYSVHLGSSFEPAVQV